MYHVDRMAPHTGVPIPARVGSGNGMIANHFLVQLSQVPKQLFHYSLRINRMTRDGDVDDTDMCLDERDPRLLTSIVRELVDQQVQFRKQGSKHVGLTYDGRSAVFATIKLVTDALEGRFKVTT